MYKKTNSLPHNNKESGFSLIELMVGLVIGLLVTLVIMQSFSMFEGQKRTTMGTADAQTNGNIALYNIQRDLKMAGYGLPVFSSDDPPPALCGARNLFPINIVDGGDGSDTITIRYGTSQNGGIKSAILGNEATAGATPLCVADADCYIKVKNYAVCGIGETAILTDYGKSTCTSATVSDKLIAGATAAEYIKVKDTNGNIVGSLQGGVAGFTVMTDPQVSCVGTWNTIVYQVNNHLLERNGTPSVTEVVNIQAQYGVSDKSTDNTIAHWVDATAALDNSTLIKAVRVAVVARNGLLEKDIVTTPCTTAQGTVNNGPCAWDDATTTDPAPKIDLSADASWQNYRYRVYETIIPLRNMVWFKPPK